MKIQVLVILMISVVLPFTANAKKKTYRKVQEVSFGEMDLKGTVRNPDGAYLVQKRGIRFLPLYEVQKTFDKKIRESNLYMR